MGAAWTGPAIERRLRAVGGRSAAVGRGRWRPLEDRLPELCLPVAGEASAGAVRVAAVGIPLLGLAVGGVVLGVVGVLAVVTAAVVAVRTAPARRSARYERELPELLEQVARHLRAGGSLAQAVASASPPSTPSGLADEWAEVVALVPAVGAAAALARWGGDGSSGDGSRGDGALATARRPGPRPGPGAAVRTSTRLAAAALAMAADTGGSPARAVDGVAATLRSRLAIADEVRALASQARASSVVIAVAPLGFAALAGATDDRTAAFFRSPAGAVVGGVGLTLDAVGAWWMSRLCRPPAAERERA